MRLSLLLPLLILSCGKPKVAAPPPAPAPEPPPPPPAYAVELTSALDPSTNACDDFYQYACGGWLKATPLPSDKPVWSRSFSTIRDRNVETLHNILEKAAKEPTAGDADWAKIGAFYGSCMDEASIDAAGAAALQPWMTDIAKIKDVKGFMSIAGRLSLLSTDAFVGAYIDGDYKDPKTSILYLTEGGIALPDRDYYLKTDADSTKMLAEYEAHVATMLGFAGVPTADAAKQAKAVVAFEKAIAEAEIPRAELRDPDKTYHKIDRVGLLKLNPGLHWEAYLAGAGAPDATAISVETPEVFTKLEKLLKKTDATTMRAYLTWNAIHALAPQLAKPIYDANFAMFSKALVGQQEPEVRWKRCSTATDAALGEITGKYYVKERFPGDSKEVALGLIKDVEGAFAAGLPGLSWMDDPTRAKAIEKKDKITNKIGYPDAWRDYSALTIVSGKHADNVIAARLFENHRQMAKIGKPADRGEWFMSAGTVNAYYNATMNEMVFPAGILQPPFFDHNFPSAMNYGAIGMIMGHELSHGFDDSGRKFDGDGKMSEWWPPEVAKRYEERANCVKEQFDGYTVGDDIHVKGDLTLGENIADLGGTRASYRAWKAKAQPGTTPAVPGLTDDQLFFIAYAQGWCTVSAPQWDKMLVLSNPHSPAKYRVNGPLTNLPEFHSAFGCAEGKPMHPAKTCEVW